MYVYFMLRQREKQVGREWERLTVQVEEQGRVTQLEGAGISKKSSAMKPDKTFALHMSCVPGLTEERFAMQNRQVIKGVCVPNLVWL